MSLICESPPLFSNSDSAPSTSSTSGAEVVRAIGIIDPSWSRVPPAPVVGAISDTYFSPSNEVCWTAAAELAGSLTEPLTSTTTFAHHWVDPLSGLRQSCNETLVTLPIETSSTLTADCGTRSRTLANWMVTEYGWL